MPKLNLTVRRVEALLRKPPAGDSIYSDTEVPGLRLRFRPGSGGEALARWELFYRAAGIQRRMRLGDASGVGLEAARKAARLKLAEVSHGKDPLAVVEESKAIARREREAPTVADLGVRFLSDYLAKRKPATRVAVEVALRRHILPALGKLRVEEVTPQHVASLHRRMKGSPTQANRVAAYLSKMMAFAAYEGMRTGPNPCRGLERYPEKRRAVRFSAEDLGKLGAALQEVEADGSELPSAVLAIRLLALTGARKEEILGLEWSRVDLETGVLRLDEHKSSRTRGPKEILLGKRAVKLLARMPQDGPWVIPGRGGRLVGFARPWGRILARAGLSGRTPHDLRRTFASVAGDLGYPEAFVAEFLGHGKRTVTAGYILPAASPLRLAADAISGAIDAMLRGERGAKVAKLFTFPARAGA